MVLRKIFNFLTQQQVLLTKTPLSIGHIYLSITSTVRGFFLRAAFRGPRPGILARTSAFWLLDTFSPRTSSLALQPPLQWYKQWIVWHFRAPPSGSTRDIFGRVKLDPGLAALPHGVGWGGKFLGQNCGFGNCESARLPEAHCWPGQRVAKAGWKILTELVWLDANVAATETEYIQLWKSWRSNAFIRLLPPHVTLIWVLYLIKW